jgi:hypothetical protein
MMLGSLLCHRRVDLDQCRFDLSSGKLKRFTQLFSALYVEVIRFTVS